MKKAMQHRNVLLRLVAVALLLYALGTVTSVSRKLKECEAAEKMRMHQLQQLQEENTELTEKLSGSGKDEEMERLARDRLGMVRPGDLIFYFTQGVS